MVLPGPTRLSVAALTWLLEAEQLGEPHPVLASAAVWRPSVEEDELRTATRAEIAALGWYDRRARLDVEVAAALAMVCRAESEFFGWITRDRTTIGVLAAGLGKHGLMAIRDEDSVWLKHIGRDTLAETLVAQLPDVAAGQGKPLAVSRVELMRGRRVNQTAVRVGQAGSDARQVQRIMALPRTGSGELYAAARDGMGRYWASEPVRYADTQDGRYLNLPTGTDQVLVAPARPTDLVDRLTRLARSRPL
jgi:EspG family